jgi:hypothetical protein
MPTFYLHFSGDKDLPKDEDGFEFADDAAARNAAIEGLRDVAAAEIARGELNSGRFIVIMNERRERIATVSFDDAVQVRGRADDAYTN